MTGLLTRSMALAAALSVLLLVNGYPLVFPDSGTYLRQAIALEGALDRPPFYSIAVFPLHLKTTLWLIPIAQNLVSAAVVLRCLSIVFPGAHPARLTAAAILTSLTTSWPFFSNQIMPDIFTPIIILLIYAATVGFARLSRAERILVPLALTICCALHQASPLFVIALGTVMIAWHGWSGAPWRVMARTGLLVIVPAVLAGLAQTAYGYAVAGRLTPSPYGPVFMLARLLDDGPALQLLHDKCPAAGFTLCRDLSAIKGDHNALLWTEQSVIAGLVRDRGPLGAIAEASAIVSATIRAYPLQVLGYAARNAVRQLVSFETTGADCPCTGMKIDHVVTDYFPREKDAFLNSRQNRGDLPWTLIERVHGAIVLLAASFLAGVLLFQRKRLAGPPGVFLAFLVTACVLNAALMGALSGVVDRYQARVIWLVPLFATALLLARGPWRRDTALE